VVSVRLQHGRSPKLCAQSKDGHADHTFSGRMAIMSIRHELHATDSPSLDMYVNGRGRGI
jgi:hypothetical protein